MGRNARRDAGRSNVDVRANTQMDELNARTQQALAELEIANSHLSFCTVALEAIAAGMVVADATAPSIPIIFASRPFLLLTGYSEEEVVGRNCRFLQGPETDPQVVSQIREAVRSGSPFSGQILNYRKDGTPFWNYLRILPIRDTDGKLTHFVGVQTDITSRVQAETKLRESDERFQLIANAIEDVFWLYSSDLKTAIYVSQAYETIWGRPLEEVYQSPDSFLHAVHPDDLEIVKEALSKMTMENWCIDFRIVHPNGSIRWIRDRGFPIYGDQGQIRYMACVASDITQRKMAEQKAQEAERLATIGKLAAFVVHEINNPLSAAFSAAQAAISTENHASSSDYLRECLETVVKSIRRCNQIVTNVLWLSRQQPSEKSLQDVNLVVTRACEFVRAQAAQNRVAIQLDLADQFKAMMNAAEFEQVMINLLSNAMEASGPNSTIKVRTYRASDAVCIDVSDNGRGMTQEQQRHIFEPFYSARPNGMGHGLGLSIVHEIIQNHGGRIDVVSEPDKGTVFTIRLNAQQPNSDPK
jgi:PAS domain S-box-containing protein